MSDETISVFNCGINFDESLNFTEFLCFLNSYFENVSLEELHFFVTHALESSATEVYGWHVFTHDENVSFEDDVLRINFESQCRGNAYDSSAMTFRSFVDKVSQEKDCCVGCFTVKRPLKFWLNIISEYVSVKEPTGLFFVEFFTEDSFKVSSSFEKNVSLLESTGFKISSLAGYYNYEKSHAKLSNLYLPFLYHLQDFVRNDEKFIPYVNTEIFSKLVTTKFADTGTDKSFIEAHLLKGEKWRDVTPSELKSLLNAHFNSSCSKNYLGEVVNVLMQVRKQLLNIPATSEDTEVFALHAYPTYREYHVGDFNSFTSMKVSSFLAYVYGKFTDNLFYMVLPVKFFKMFDCYSYRVDWVEWESSYSLDVLSNTLGLYRSLEKDFSLSEIVETAATV